VKSRASTITHDASDRFIALSTLAVAGYSRAAEVAPESEHLVTVTQNEELRVLQRMG
jgi:hypothetical protein